MKKRFYIRLVSLMLVLILLSVGCTNNSTSPQGSTPAPEASTAQTAPEDKWGGLITLSVLPQCDEPVDPKSPVTAAIEKKFNIKLNYWYLERNNLDNLLAVRMAAGDIPDLFSANNQNYFTSYKEQGVIAKIPKDDLIKYAPALYKITMDDFKALGNIWELTALDGAIYGIPIGSVTGKYTSPNIWRGDWLKKVGITEIPDTAAKAEDAFYKFARNDPDGNGKNDTYAMSNQGMTRWLWSYGGDGITFKLDSKGNVIFNLMTDTFYEGFGKLVKFYADGLIDPEFITGENRGQYWASSIALWNGLIGFTAPGNFYHVNPSVIDGDGGSSVNSTGFSKQNPGKFYDYGKMLKGPETYTPVAGTYPNVMKVIGAKADEKKMRRILSIFDAICSDFEGAWMLTEWGIKDVTYTVQKDSKGVPIYKRIGQFAIGNTDPYDPGLKGNGINLIESSCYEFCKAGEAQLYAWGDANATPEVLGAPEYINPCYGVLSDDALTIKRNIETKYKEAYNLFITGQRPFTKEEWAKFIKELNGIGMQKLLDEATKWVNNNKSKK